MKRVNINGKEYPVQFNANALFDFIDITCISIDELIKSFKGKGARLSFADARLLIWCGLKEGHREAGIPFQMTNYDVGKLFDPIQQNMKYLKEFLDILTEQISEPEVNPEELGNLQPAKVNPLK